MGILRVNEVLLNLEDKPLKDTQVIKQEITCPNCGHTVVKAEIEERGNLTLGIVSRGALINVSDKEKDVSGSDKDHRFYLALQIKSAEKAGEDADLDTEDIALIKKLIGNIFGPMIVHRAWSIIDPKKEKDKPESKDSESKISGKKKK